MKITLIVGFFLLIINSLCFYYINGFSNVTEAINSGFLGNISVLTIYLSAGVYIPTLMMVLHAGAKNNTLQ